MQTTSKFFLLNRFNNSSVKRIKELFPNMLLKKHKYSNAIAKG